MTKYDPTTPPKVFFHCAPKANACDHDWSGWRDFVAGNGGECFCKKCGMGAVHHTLTYEEMDRASRSPIAPIPEDGE